jgi:glycosyltransferase involved in cell wall biosynthesis
LKILFVHQNFPGQFLHLAPELARRGHHCVALTDQTNTKETSTPTFRYRHATAKPDAAACRLGRTYTEMTDRGVTVARAAQTLRDQHGYVPDVIFGHSGWGETLFLREVWPEAKLIIYAEFYYRPTGADVGFDPEFSTQSLDQRLIAHARAGYLGHSMLHADAALSPTRWQASTFPPALQPMIKVIFDGVNTDILRPNPDARYTLPDGRVVAPGDEVLTFINRNLEPYRGYHIFMRALPEVMAARPQAQVVIVGGDDVSYGQRPLNSSWKEIFLSQVRDRLDLSRVHFLGKVPYGDFVALMQISRVHAYLTYPFVLSWSMLESMAAGAHVVGSATAPVQELITDGVNGRLVDFFDVAGWSQALIEGLEHPDRFLALRHAARQTILNGYDLHSQCLPAIADFVESVSRGDWPPRV